MVHPIKSVWYPNSKRVVQLSEVPIKLEAGKVLVKWLAAPINPADLNQIEGVYPLKPSLPAVGGNEGVGRIEEGEGRGRLVIPAQGGLGTWRQWGVHAPGELWTLPANLLPLEAACQLMVNPPTAYRLLKDYSQSGK